MKKLKIVNKQLTKNEQKNIIGGKFSGGGNGCLSEFSYGCCLPGLAEGEPCCSGLICQVNATNSGTICVSQTAS